MDVKREMEKIKNHEKLLNTIVDSGCEEYAGFIDDNHVFFNNDVDIDLVRSKFNRACGCSSDSLFSYHMNGGRLSLIYRNDVCIMVFFVTKYHDLLAKISKGKCRVIERERTTVEKVVVCEDV